MTDNYYRQLLGAAPRAGRQLVYIESCSFPRPSFSSLLSLVSSISAIYKADYSRVLYVPSQKAGFLCIITIDVLHRLELVSVRLNIIPTLYYIAFRLHLPLEYH